MAHKADRYPKVTKSIGRPGKWSSDSIHALTQERRYASESIPGAGGKVIENSNSSRMKRMRCVDIEVAEVNGYQQVRGIRLKLLYDVLVLLGEWYDQL